MMHRATGLRLMPLPFAWDDPPRRDVERRRVRCFARRLMRYLWDNGCRFGQLDQKGALYMTHLTGQCGVD